MNQIRMSLFNGKTLLVVAVLITQISSLQISDCSNAHRMGARSTLRSLRRDFLFVEKSSSSSSLNTSLNIPRRLGRDVTAPGTTTCPWRWALDDDADRVPRFLSKAVCPSCAHFCREVTYHHRGLVQRCDNTTGERVWKWIQVELPVAFVDDSAL